MTAKTPGYTLTINAGHGHVSFGVFAEDRLVAQAHAETRPGRTVDEYAVFLTHVLAAHDIPARFVTGAVLGAVAPGLEAALQSLCWQMFGFTPLVVAPGVKTGLDITYGRAGDLAPNRLANIMALAAMDDLPKGPRLVVDMGCLIIIDALDAKGAYAGGVIMPGADLALAAMQGVAPQLPHTHLHHSETVLGRDLTTSVQSGCVRGLQAMVAGLVTQIQAQMGAKTLCCVVTGDSGHIDLTDTHRTVIHKSDLTFCGLKRIYDRNEGLVRQNRTA